MMVVLAILVLISTAFPLALDRVLPARRVSSATQKLVLRLRSSQERAMLTGQPVQLAFDTLRKELPISTRLALEGRSCSEGACSITLFPDMTADAQRIDISDHERRAAIRISGVTGRIAVVAP
jgi:hypothetical protein